MRTSTLPWRLAALTAVSWLISIPSVQAVSSVNVALKASFDAAPLLVELLETAAAENATCYFPLLDRIAEGTFAECNTEKELYEIFIQVLQNDGHIRSPETLSSFKLALSLHAAAPRVQAHFQYYNRTVSPHLPAAQDAACPVWVHFDGKQYCSPTLERAQQPLELDEAEEILPFDRVLGPQDGVPASILYADITSPLFAEFHRTVSATAHTEQSSYRLRYRRSPGDRKPLFLSGYGAELNLKRTDYIVIDDRDASKHDASDQVVVKEPTSEQELQIKPLTTTEVSSLGLNAASHILSSPNPMDALVQITSNFPGYSSFLTRQNATADFLTEHRGNRERLLPAGYNVLWINGLQIEPRQVNAYSLLAHLRRERKLIEEMKTIGLSATEAVSLLSSDLIAEAQADEAIQRFDWRDESEGGNVIIWMNNLEKDKRYAGWSTALTSLFQRVYPGQLPSVARDIHNVVVPFDVGSLKDIELVVQSLQSLVKRQVPVRIGIIPGGDSERAAILVKVSYHLVETYGLTSLLTFYKEILKSKKIPATPEKYFNAVTKNGAVREDKEPKTYNQVISGVSDIDHETRRHAYLSRLELHPTKPQFVVNGVVLSRGETWFEQLSQRITLDFQTIQQAVYREALTEESWVPDFFLFQAVSRRNALVVPSDPKDVVVADVPALVSKHAEAFQRLPKLTGEMGTLLSDRAHLFLITDLDSSHGQQLLLNALQFKAGRDEIELFIAHNEGNGNQHQLSNNFWNFLGAYRQQPKDISREDLEGLLDPFAQSVIGVDTSNPQATSIWRTGSDLIRELGFEPGQSAVWLNGRVVGPLPKPLQLTDFNLLLDFERTMRIAPVTTTITSKGLEEKFTNALDLAKITSTVARSQKSELPEGLRDSMPLIRMDRFKVWNDTHTAVKLAPTKDPLIQIVASIDPASETAQSWVPILHVLSQLDGVHTKIFLNPKAHLQELPVKKFYRQVLEAAPEFDEQGSIRRPGTSFTKVPLDTLYNLGMVVPPSWLVSPEEANADPDNIKFSPSGTDTDVDVLYELEYVLIEGHAREPITGAPPRGVQLLLGTSEQPHVTDTIVMANLGYFQFKANPGWWHISIKPGRSSRIFNLDSIGPNGYSAQPGDETTSVALMSFDGITLFPRLSRKPGMDDEDVLEETKGQVAEIVNKGASFLSSFGLTKSTKSTNADINIFSVASGHLYERMLSIMLVSVMNHTSHSVKFWFIEQFLSPSFKDTLPILAEHYGFQYEMVTYKWPHWLRAQKEKQREIWGYKILFLDVLFPLDLDKVIFVDADQIVRTDMMELNKVDLHGAPYGFTPMCDSRTEMEGFRFWKQGYWSTYLRGKPYHISALYVVDLKKFRQVAAGDRLRGQYQALSADPASLSNLDQDLPNHMQHNLPIFSLPQDWLWCETWCSDEALLTAKTIDLCNNPQTKEPKLDRARRQVPEWTKYDDDIARVIKEQRVEPKDDFKFADGMAGWDKKEL